MTRQNEIKFNSINHSIRRIDRNDCEIDRIENCKNEDKIIINDTEIILDAYVNKKVDKVFYDIIEDFEIKTGDITPMQSDDVNQFKITIKQYIKQNLGLNEECDLNGE